MKAEPGAVFDPETVVILKSSLDDAWAQLTAAEQAQTSRTVLAERILKAAAGGERDPVRLRASALVHVVAPPMQKA
jgi:hypothetical protein